ncbi:MAG: alkaline phosphatase family protein [Candidatus Nitrosopolaris sp.]
MITNPIMNRKFTLIMSLALIIWLTLNFSIVPARAASIPSSVTTSTPIKHLVIIFQENISFDHYFGTYPNATNPQDEPKSIAAQNTSTVNNLLTKNLLPPNNPNLSQPHRIDRSKPVTCSPLHGYTDEQKSYNGGKTNLFVQNDGRAPGCQKTPTDNQVMDYYDGNTVTALWNYAQKFAMSDNFYGSTFGPSTPGHINLVSGNTHDAFCVDVNGNKLDDCTEGTHSGVVGNTLIADIDPTYDICSEAPSAGSTITTPPVYQVEMTGKNIGDLLTTKGISWGWFSGGFTLPSKGDCSSRSRHIDSSGNSVYNYYPDVEPFQYYKSTANPHHLPPTSVAKIGYADQANHQYSLSDFWTAAKADNMPAVSFIKAPDYQQGHPQSSDPLAEQTFLVETINKIQRLPQWSNTAIMVTWDDSGGWYDHVMPPTISKSNDPKNDALYGPTILCNPHPVVKITQNDKCGYGPRIPMLIISPYTKVNFVDHTPTDFTSILKFIEDNWGLWQIGGGSLDVLAKPLDNMFDFKSPHTTPLFLNPSTGQIRYMMSQVQ